MTADILDTAMLSEWRGTSVGEDSPSDTSIAEAKRAGAVPCDPSLFETPVAVSIEDVAEDGHERSPRASLQSSDVPARLCSSTSGAAVHARGRPAAIPRSAYFQRHSARPRRASTPLGPGIGSHSAVVTQSQQRVSDIDTPVFNFPPRIRSPSPTAPIAPTTCAPSAPGTKPLAACPQSPNAASSPRPSLRPHHAVPAVSPSATSVAKKKHKKKSPLRREMDKAKFKLYRRVSRAKGMSQREAREVALGLSPGSARRRLKLCALMVLRCVKIVKLEIVCESQGVPLPRTGAMKKGLGKNGLRPALFTVANTGFIGRYIGRSSSHSRLYTLEELKKKGFRVIEWNGR